MYPEYQKGSTRKSLSWLVLLRQTTCLPAMLIFKSYSGRVPNGVTEGALAETLFAGKMSGWINKDLSYSGLRIYSLN